MCWGFSWTLVEITTGYTVYPHSCVKRWFLVTKQDYPLFFSFFFFFTRFLFVIQEGLIFLIIKVSSGLLLLFFFRLLEKQHTNKFLDYSVNLYLKILQHYFMFKTVSWVKHVFSCLLSLQTYMQTYKYEVSVEVVEVHNVGPADCCRKRWCHPAVLVP